MRIFFIGTVEFSLRALELLVQLPDAEVVGVATREASKFNADFADLTPVCREAGIPYQFLTDLNTPESIGWIRSLRPDVVFCFGWSSLLKMELLNLAPLGVVGYHPAALPLNRGRHPLIWALALGLDRTASTFFFMDEGADSGDILSQAPLTIGPTDDAADLYAQMIATALRQIAEFVPQLASGTYPRQPQNHVGANIWRKRGRADGRLDFRMHAVTFHNLVRALARPYVGAHLELNGQDVKVWRAQPAGPAPANLEAGKVLAVDEATRHVTVKTADGAIILLEHELPELPAVGAYL